MFRSFQVRHVRLSRALATHASAPATRSLTRHDWAKQEIQQIYDTPLLELVYRAASVHRQHQDPTKIQLCTLMNIKSAFATSAVSPQRLTSNLLSRRMFRGLYGL